MFNTIADKKVTAEITEKKSKFIASVFYIESQEEAEKIIAETKKQYHDARHNCFAYSIYNEGNIINKFSDDGEPSGTAGSPMLNMIVSKQLSNILVIVTRYFGGILLGTGGLLRAYTGAFQEALNLAKEVKKDVGLEAKIKLYYSELEKAKYYLGQNKINIVDIKYDEVIEIIIELSKEKYEMLDSQKANLNFKIVSLEMLKNKYIEI